MSSSTTTEVVDALSTTNMTLPEKSTSHPFPNETYASSHHESDAYIPPTPSVKLLFSLLSRRDLFLILLPAFILSMLAGGVAPFMTLVIGSVFETFSKFSRIQSPTSGDRASFKREITISVIELVALAAGALVLSSLTSFLWILTGERNSLMIRQKVYASVSSRDMAWFDSKMGSEDDTQANGDSTSPGGLMAKFARQVLVTCAVGQVFNSSFALAKQNMFALDPRSQVVSLSSILLPALPASFLVFSIRGLLPLSSFPLSRSS
jgi:ATP-binding cassette, subfamily B (MDR/TAP), member 1